MSLIVVNTKVNACWPCLVVRANRVDRWEKSNSRSVLKVYLRKITRNERQSRARWIIDRYRCDKCIDTLWSEVGLDNNYDWDKKRMYPAHSHRTRQIYTISMIEFNVTLECYESVCHDREHENRFVAVEKYNSYELDKRFNLSNTDMLKILILIDR
jgi:hypothetical protein